MARIILKCLTILFLSTPGLAADLQTQNRAAKKACLTGDYRKGVEILADLFIETSDPIHLFNQGRCFEQSHQWQEAIDRFREYLRKSPNLGASELADANKHIADCEGFLEKEEGKAGAVTSGPPSPAPVALEPAQPPTSSAREPTSIATDARAHPASGSGLRTAGWVMAGVGVAAIATGVVLNIKANALADELWKRQSQTKESQHDTLKTWSWVSYGAGALSLAAGAALYVWGMRPGEGPSNSARLAVLPAAAPGGATLHLSGGF